MKLNRVGIGSAAKIAGAMYGAMGLIFGGFFAIFALVGAGFAGMAAEQGGEAMPAFVGPLFGVGAIVLFPILYGLMGVVVGAISAALYNLFARMVGGLEIEIA
jgi:hypothetical protein